MTSQADLMLAQLLKGERVGTDPYTALQFGTNQVPDLARKLRKRGIDVKSKKKVVESGGEKKRVTEYYLPPKAINEVIQSQAGAQ